MIQAAAAAHLEHAEGARLPHIQHSIRVAWDLFEAHHDQGQGQWSGPNGSGVQGQEFGGLRSRLEQEGQGSQLE